ncbi:peptide-methionine (R)-S-oxide reductase MsrB [Sphingomonas sp.]|uniref:peptide-methionine (R)-S-oxide reductase MsrB n=1 Tax=Sphingomonas sp. TaxID=28214 RepID=UPI00286D542D|nr:peptide-methionine (R)-S-oxide reductase MsrB [Sphingomonas sp.]
MMTKSKLDRRTLLGAAGLGLAALAVTRGTAAQGRFPYTLTDAEWRQRLGPDRYRVLRQAATERAGTSPLNNEHRRGRFVCAGCANPLFASTTKFDSGTGWPSFFQALPGGTAERGLKNMFFGTEIACARCGGHLGHVFNDGPKPTGLRYCMNGLALRFQPA